MGAIVCATRGGAACHRTQERAIELAKERDVRLVFLFVADTSFADVLDQRLASAVEDELSRLGRSLLYIAQVRAQDRGVKAEIAVSQGKVQSEIIEYVQKVGADTIVIGAPQIGPLRQRFTSEGLGRFVAAMQQATGAEVLVV